MTKACREASDELGELDVFILECGKKVCAVECLVVEFAPVQADVIVEHVCGVWD